MSESTDIEVPSLDLPPHLDAMYEATEDGQFRVYAGPIEVALSEGETIAVEGDILLELAPHAVLFCNLRSDTHSAFLMSTYEVLGPPEGISLEPPAVDTPLATDRSDGNTTVRHSGLNRIIRGDLAGVDELLIHVGGRFGAHLPHVDTAPAPSRQPQLQFEAPGWQMTIASVRADPDDQHLFSHVIRAERTSAPEPTPEDVEELLQWLFHVLSFVGSREIGLPIVVGLRDGEVAWVYWASPRQRNERGGVGWCTKFLVAEALPAVAHRLTKIKDTDPALYKVVLRAIGFHLMAEAGGVLDVRVPIACAGVELLSWAVLQRDGWMSTETMERLTAGAKARLFVRASGIPESIPDGFSALEARIASEHKVGEWAAPEALFRVRNALMHPPKRLTSIEWPSSDELLESWQLSMWYLEMGILRVLGYDGRYWSRLRLGRFEGEVERVPWADALVD